MFGKPDFEHLAEQLAGIKGRFLLSINDVPQIRRIFSAFKIQAVKTTYTLRDKGEGKLAHELLVSN